MKHFVQNLILVIILTILLLFSYAFLQKKTENFGLSEFYQFLFEQPSGQQENAAKNGAERKRASRRKTKRTIHIGQSGSAIWNLMPTAVL